MANEQNLTPFTSDQSREEAAKNGRLGGIASGKARAEKRDLRKALEMLLEKEFTDKNGNVATGAQAITAKLFEQAMKGNVKAFETLRDTVGQKPVEKVMIADVDPAVIEDIERIVADCDDATLEDNGPPGVR